MSGTNWRASQKMSGTSASSSEPERSIHKTHATHCDSEQPTYAHAHSHAIHQLQGLATAPEVCQNVLTAARPTRRHSLACSMANEEVCADSECCATASLKNNMCI